MSDGADLQPGALERSLTAVRSRRPGGRRVRRWRRILSVTLLLAAALVAIQQRSAPAPGFVAVSAARELAVGDILTPGDLVLVNQPALPGGARTDPGQVLGRTAAGPIRRGEVLTDARLVPLSGPAPGPGRVAVPIRPADPGTVALLSPGMHVAALVVDERGHGILLAADAVVLAIPPPDPGHPDRRMVVLGISAEKADRLAAAALGGSVTLRFT